MLAGSICGLMALAVFVFAANTSPDLAGIGIALMWLSGMLWGSSKEG